MSGASKYNRKNREKSRDIGTKSRAKTAKVDFARPDDSDPVAWLLAYLPRAFPLPFGAVHLRIVDAVVYAIEHGGSVAVAAPRGTGKSTLVNGLLLWALLTGRTAFPVVVPWDDRAKRRALRFWSGELCFNKRLARDYAEITAPFVASRGVANKLTALHDDGAGTGARLGITEGIIVLPGGRGAIGSATINGNPRGLNYATIDGRVVRPSYCVIDDPQDRETARSKTRVADTIERIDGDVAGMAGPDERMAMVMLCTVIERDDVAEHFLSRPGWQSIRVGQVTAWPVGWDDKDSAARRAWDEWNGIRQDGERDKDGGAGAMAYYDANKAAMTAGMSVSWAERYDRKRGQPDALYAAMHDFYTMGESAFAAERQNEPLRQGVTLYTLTPESILARATDRPAWVAPEWTRARIAVTDVNPSYGLTWTMCGFGADQTAAVLAYGVHAMSTHAGATAAEQARDIYAALVSHGRELARSAVRPELWLVDAGGANFDAVLRFCRESQRVCGLAATPCTGRGARNYRPWGKRVLGTPREQCHMAVDTGGRKWIAWNADYWREAAQRAWTGADGAPGTCDLPRGRHEDFAAQICRESLRGKGEIGGQMVWIWDTQPGAHDYGDCMAMAFMGAAWGGIGSAGQVAVRPKKYIERRKSKVQREL